jgi:hypothetical protein
MLTGFLNLNNLPPDAGVIWYGTGRLFLIFQVQTSFLNPNNLSLDADGYFTNPEVLQRVPSVFLLLGKIMQFCCRKLRYPCTIGIV